MNPPTAGKFDTGLLTSASPRDLATRHEKTLHVDQYVPPDRAQQQTPLAGQQSSSPDSPPSGPTASPSPLPLVTGVDSQASTAATSDPTVAGDLSDAQAWTALLGLDAFDHFPEDDPLEGLPYLGSSTADPFRLAAMDLSVTTEPLNHHESLQPAADTNPHSAGGNGPWIPPSPAVHLHGDNTQPWPPPLPSVGPEVPAAHVPDAVISSLRASLGEEDRGGLTPAAIRLFLGSYFDVFNVHLPLLHEPSFEFAEQPTGLLLAMAAVGAMYRLERRALGVLYRAADAAAPVGASPVQIGSFHGGVARGAAGTDPPPPWRSLGYYQARLLLQYVGIQGGDAEPTDRSLGMIAELSFTVRNTRGPSGVGGACLVSMADAAVALSDPGETAEGVGRRSHVGQLVGQGVHETVPGHPLHLQN